jgi:DNA-binding NtrC family response regulator
MGDFQVKRPYDRTSHILVVDDDDTLLKFFKIHLNKFFSRVLVVETAKQAMEAIRDKDIDLVLTDIRMPKVDGLQLMQKIKRGHPDLPILLISGEPMSDEQQDVAGESDGFLKKPFSIDQLNNYIHFGADLRQTLKDLALLLKDPKKVRTALAGPQKNLAKYVQKEHLKQAQGLWIRWHNQKSTLQAA